MIMPSAVPRGKPKSGKQCRPGAMPEENKKPKNLAHEIRQMNGSMSKASRNCPKPAPQSVALPVKFWRGRIGRARLRRAAQMSLPYRGIRPRNHRVACDLVLE